MAISSAVTRKLNNGYVQIDIGPTNREPHSYKVPETRADEFQREYKKNSKKVNLASAGIMFAAVAATLFPTAHFTKNIEKKFLKTVLQIGAGIAGGVAAMFLCNRVEMNSHQKLLNKYDAELIDKSQLGLKLD